MKSVCLAILGIVLAVSRAGAAEPFSINDALRESAKSHPGVGEAAANRRATESELRQTQSTLLPQVRIDAYYGREKFDQSASICRKFSLFLPLNRRLAAGSREFAVRQLLFDGLASIHDIWRQSAGQRSRVSGPGANGTAARTPPRPMSTW
jgi:adhesin transport system outer membrane protein